MAANVDPLGHANEFTNSGAETTDIGGNTLNVNNVLRLVNKLLKVRLLFELANVRDDEGHQ